MFAYGFALESPGARCVCCVHGQWDLQRPAPVRKADSRRPLAVQCFLRVSHWFSWPGSSQPYRSITLVGGVLYRAPGPGLHARVS